MSVDCPRCTPPKLLREMVRRLGRSATLRGSGEAAVTGINQDSRLVRAGDVYAALPGRHRHGIEFAVEAAARGAVAMLSDRGSDVLPTVVVDDPRRVLGPLAAWVYGNPSEALDVYGVTGTNGKTSTAYLLDAGLRAAGVATGMMTGITVRGPNGSRTATRTTPEACELQQTLAAFAEHRIGAVAMEVSSHGLALHRIDGTSFRVGVFTNLARDHLDFHPDMDAYFAAKARLFEPGHCAAAAIGIDDEFGRRLAATVAVPRVTFSSRTAAADFHAAAVHADEGGTSFTLHGAGARKQVRLRLLGVHQVDNALAAIAALAARGVDLDSAVGGLENLDTVPGRLEAVDAGQPFLAFVDYMHNTAGQRRLFPYLRSLTRGRVIAVVGATGERDPGKRVPLGATAARFADTVIVTDESPYSDDAQRLREDVARGARSGGGADVLVLPDRAEAIVAAVTLAAPGDVVVVAGRGHDRVQAYGPRRRVFDDRIALHEALLRLVAG
ncbi:UDP-N-acetylmuramoyl-L-alanyl-D-glutamate--2,6-diaminopimelate ligase [Rhodococcus opacus]|uniref:UDP-N-acetylmuramyl-tripeptide synthetase n=1 Tax=Rhodococcus opacus TaxID=37919 RepID=A0AAX3YAS7_RHOOP|nr:UDP-N-acetylmuramoyl-L-alanyl-D-glutamate--2,6-diaminopimelate ligase [Rhodococcus opacus]MCZ4588422.1 UDP-N-acetylmuramoyl-L-alanyl-D-glutamate--2,6-diaminopimelate ligase [Rhodococcus opacus]WLF45300.1 UDP-N-acetylmuramoyl-L-alanyl-D-glutamate--2,6-diaminopimelate ligase [Rhodococcus opacus]